jgi:hypothetical protein
VKRRLAGSEKFLQLLVAAEVVGSGNPGLVISRGTYELDELRRRRRRAGGGCSATAGEGLVEVVVRSPLSPWLLLLLLLLLSFSFFFPLPSSGFQFPLSFSWMCL